MVNLFQVIQTYTVYGRDTPSQYRPCFSSIGIGIGYHPEISERSGRGSYLFAPQDNTPGCLLLNYCKTETIHTCISV